MPIHSTSSPSPSAQATAFLHAAVIADLEADFTRLVDRAITAVVSGDAKPDAVFGKFADFISRARSVSFHEGKLLEAGIIRIAACNPDLAVMPQDKSMPIVPAAIEFLKRNAWSALEGIRLRSEVHNRESYTPDLVIVNCKRHSALIVDVKRSLASYAEHRLEMLRHRMMAVALIASDWLYVEHKGPLVSEVGIAIIDGSGQASDHARGVFGLGEVGDLLEVAGAGAALAHLRAKFAARVQEELGRQCRTVLAAIEPASPLYLEGPSQYLASAHSRSGPVSTLDCDASVIAEEAHRLAGSGTGPDPRVKVGFARARASP